MLGTRNRWRSSRSSGEAIAPAGAPVGAALCSSSEALGKSKVIAPILLRTWRPSRSPGVSPRPKVETRDHRSQAEAKGKAKAKAKAKGAGKAEVKVKLKGGLELGD